MRSITFVLAVLVASAPTAALSWQEYEYKDYGFAVGHPADVVIIDAQTGEQAVAEIAQPLAAFKRGRQTVAWERPALIRPD